MEVSTHTQKKNYTEFKQKQMRDCELKLAFATCFLKQWEDSVYNIQSVGLDQVSTLLPPVCDTHHLLMFTYA